MEVQFCFNDPELQRTSRLSLYDDPKTPCPGGNADGPRTPCLGGNADGPRTPCPGGDADGPRTPCSGGDADGLGMASWFIRSGLSTHPEATGEMC